MRLDGEHTQSSSPAVEVAVGCVSKESRTDGHAAEPLEGSCLLGSCNHDCCQMLTLKTQLASYLLDSAPLRIWLTSSPPQSENCQCQWATQRCDTQQHSLFFYIFLISELRRSDSRWSYVSCSIHVPWRKGRVAAAAAACKFALSKLGQNSV